MFIYVGCAGGGTSSMLCQRIVKAIQQDENLTAIFTDVGNAFRKQREYGNDYDLVFAYGGIGAIRSYNAFDFGRLFDVVFVAPQVRFLTPTVKDLLREFTTVVRDIPMKIFGMMDGPRAFADLLDELITLDDERAYQSATMTATKASDKDIEILVVGGDSQSSYFQQCFAEWETGELPYSTENFSLERLYQFETTADVGLRLLFASSAQLKEEELPKVARRIDGVWVMPQSQLGFQEKIGGFREYQIPVFQPEAREVFSMQGASKQQDFLLEVLQHAEYTREISVARYEEPPRKERKTFLGIFSWE
ncbi:hypothetical protein RU97_GL001415 [Enterococcus canis]|uniref:PTS EIIB type-3 domain-containing protein n=1 Tax=Enterococcus canis TaxID=214095 RepID=A0A1L8RGC6_9ENTE|nr:hypothetical protein [Enterococcus canis]OJG18797.1 hypothetical protein RU97_GL001415 [Enterococcus canis]